MPLNKNHDGPFAYTDANAVRSYDRTEWVLEGMIENDDLNCGGTRDFTSWGSAAEPIEVYADEKFPGPVCERGTEIIQRLIDGATVEEIDAAMEAWRGEI